MAAVYSSVHLLCCKVWTLWVSCVCVWMMWPLWVVVEVVLKILHVTTWIQQILMCVATMFENVYVSELYVLVTLFPVTLLLCSESAVINSADIHMEVCACVHACVCVCVSMCACTCVHVIWQWHARCTMV